MHGIERTRKLQEELPQSMRVVQIVFRYTDGRTLTFIPEAGREAFIEDDMDGLLVEELSHKYTGGPYPGFAGPNPQWVTARITADRVTTSWPDS
jgi:hypothetical protein